jgi:dUTPase
MAFKFTKIRDVQSPSRWTELSSGIDFYIPRDLKAEDLKITPCPEPLLKVEDFITEDEIIIPAWKGMLIPSWLKVYMDPGDHNEVYDLVLAWKSGVSIKTNLIVWASVIDNDYRGEFNIHLINPTDKGIILKKGAKVIQWIIRKVQLSDLVEVPNDYYETLANTERGEGWFGSTWV